MKRFIGFLAALSAAVAVAASVSASDIAVKVDGRTVTFREEPKPVIIEDRTYVPIRRVLEYMGAKVAWDEETRTVKVTSSDNVTIVMMTIDNPEITVYKYTSVLHADKSVVKSDVAPIILNDRTMLPIRVVAEALGADVEYDESGVAEITTVKAKSAYRKIYKKELAEQDKPIAEALSENLPKISIYSDAKDVKEGDTVYVYTRVTGIDTYSSEGDAKFAGVVTTLLYESDKFEYVGYKCISEDGETAPALSADNGEFYENGAKIIYIYSPDKLHDPAEDGTVLRIEFTALADGGGSFAISDGVSEIGYDNEVIFIDGDNAFSLYKFDELFIDTTALEVK